MILAPLLALVLAAAFVALLFSVRGNGPVVLLDGLVQAALAPLRSRQLVAAFDWLTQMGTGAAGVAVLAGASGLLLTSGRAGFVGPIARVLVRQAALALRGTSR